MLFIIIYPTLATLIIATVLFIIIYSTLATLIISTPVEITGVCVYQRKTRKDGLREYEEYDDEVYFLDIILLY